MSSMMDYTSLGCCALAFILYLNTLNSGFVYDDRRAILANTDVSGTASWQSAFLHDYWGTPLTDSGSHGSYRPLTVLTFKLNFILSGYNPWGFHLVNNLLHCLATGLVVKVARHFLSSVWGVVATGALFAAHPIHTEAVAGIVGRADLAACVCYLLTFLTYMRHIAWRERGDPLQWLALSLTLVSSIAALLFKETAITALIICGMFDVIRGLSGLRDKHRIRSVCVLTSVLLGTVYCRLAVIPRPQTLFSTADNPIAKTNSAWTRFLTFLYLPVFNFKLLLNPQVLSFDWGMNAIPRINSIWDGRNVLSMGFYGALTYTAWQCCRLLLQRHKRLQYYAHYKTRQQASSSYGVTGAQYHLQPQMQRKSRTKRKYCKQVQCQTSNGTTATVTSDNQTQPYYMMTPPPSPPTQHYSTSTPILTTNYSSLNSTTAYLKHKLLGINNPHICGDCKQELSSGHHTNSCRVLNNNNNVLTLNHSNVYHTGCCCHQLMSSSDVSSNGPPPQIFTFALQKAIASVVAARSSRSSSSCSNSTTASNKSSDSSASSTCSSGSSLSSKSLSSHRNLCLATWSSIQQEDFMLSDIPHKCANVSVLLMALAFLTLPFLPATNLVFYVGFVVAERLLYLPSFGFCLLVGFGFGKLIDRVRTSKNPRHQQMLILSLCLVLCALSARTIKRNLDWRDEESLYRSAVQINPPKALGNLGSVLSSQARYKEAEEVLLEAIKYRPNMADVHFNLGILYQNQQNYKNAVKSFKNALNFRPNLAVAYLNLGISLIALGKCQDAAQILQEGTKVDGTGVRDRSAHENARISSYLQLGALYVEQGKLQRALAVYREALHELPHHYYKRDVIYHRIGDIFGRLQQWDEAERHHRAALEMQPNQVAAHLSYGVTLARNSSRVSEAEMWFKRALQLAPEEASVYHHYAEFLTTQTRLAEAISYRVKAAELASQDYSLVVAAATALRLMDRKQEAEIWYRKAVNLRPSDAHAHTNLGAILHLLGHTSKAAASYKEALRLQPGDATTLGNLAKLGLTETK
ncbi:Transmembrane and TPR repeat-containing protein [Lucilia cuprina]|uniref:dolichyl-phosphate-mannose--protein mannosyltransferase n=1 Tax=Lucilia cuprina TaxID=7375 RepID=A0A0L0CG41_LUCCU|nr:Transmembrane and TPR repeat-containing protein [Lucilia cuprina]